METRLVCHEQQRSKMYSTSVIGQTTREQKLLPKNMRKIFITVIRLYYSRALKHSYVIKCKYGKTTSLYV